MSDTDQEKIIITIPLRDMPNLGPRGIKELMTQHGMAHAPYVAQTNHDEGTMTITGWRILPVAKPIATQDLKETEIAEVQFIDLVSFTGDNEIAGVFTIGDGKTLMEGQVRDDNSSARVLFSRVGTYLDQETPTVPFLAIEFLSREALAGLGKIINDLLYLEEPSDSLRDSGL